MRTRADDRRWVRAGVVMSVLTIAADKIPSLATRSTATSYLGAAGTAAGTRVVTRRGNLRDYGHGRGHVSAVSGLSRVSRFSAVGDPPRCRQALPAGCSSRGAALCWHCSPGVGIRLHRRGRPSPGIDPVPLFGAENLRAIHWPGPPQAMRSGRKFAASSAYRG